MFEALDRDPGVRVIVLRGEGKHFSSGGDIRGFLDSTPEQVSELAWNVAAPERCHKPVWWRPSAASASGWGFELSLACDFRIVSETAELALPEQRIGMIPGSGGSARLVRMIGIARTKDVAMRSRRIPARQAHEWGIAVEVRARFGARIARTDAFVDELRGFSPLAQRTLKGVLNAAQDAPLHVAIELEGQAYGRLRSSEDFREGVESFYEKRKPAFRGT